MLSTRIRIAQWTGLVFILFACLNMQAQEADNEFSIDARLTTRGEYRQGGFQPDSADNARMAHFISGKYQLILGYKRSWLEVKLIPQVSGVWGFSSANISLAEGWTQLRSKLGLFAKVGRQGLEYDDERILGYDDWSMTAPTHDVLKFGYEGHGHKAHAILAYNQDPKNTEQGGNYYSGGIQPYKTMQTIWYHYDTPKSFFGISLVAMNIGMQGASTEKPTTFYQQLYGSFMTFRPKYCQLEGAFYYQSGKEEHGIPISAYMGSVKLIVQPIGTNKIYAGYDYLSGDKYFSLPPEGGLGLVFHDKIRGFSPIFGSHHDFYGAMDFFYLDSYMGNFTPGLQNLYVGGSVNPLMNWNINAAYHFFAIATKLDNLKKPLGHELEISTSYNFAKFVKIAAGYSFMIGTETMVKLQHVTDNRQLHWAWVMLSVTPTLFSTIWQDKQKKSK